jgi:light-regulated signal transduction histidine kinase (bacteriophytochrome)
MGKVIKISKNLPSVLGYEPNNLIGLSINEIIPFSVKPFHDENML